MDRTIMSKELENFDYVMYVDASGDDGFKFDNGSTACFAAAALLVKQEDIEHNLEILGQIKKVLGCKPEDEIKYSRVRRHRRADDAFALLEGIRGNLSCFVAFKKELDPVQFVGNKQMSVMCHVMAIHSIKAYPFLENTKLQIAIDRMKHTEEVPVEYHVTRESVKRDNVDMDIVFRDSKDSRYLLIQIADLLCGAIREHFEQYETQSDMLYFAQKCPPCEKMRLLRRAKGIVAHPMCKNRISRTENILCSLRLKHIFHLFPIKNCIEMAFFFFTMPTQMMDKHFYMVCNRNR